jgi:hypothetical protein
MLQKYEHRKSPEWFKSSIECISISHSSEGNICQEENCIIIR